jgi:hypothetical protein
MSNRNRKTTARRNRHGASRPHTPGQHRGTSHRTNWDSRGRQGRGDREPYEQPEADGIDIGNGYDPAKQIPAKGGYNKTRDTRYVSAQAPPDIPAKPHQQKNADRADIAQ